MSSLKRKRALRAKRKIRQRRRKLQEYLDWLGIPPRKKIPSQGEYVDVCLCDDGLVWVTTYRNGQINHQTVVSPECWKKLEGLADVAQPFWGGDRPLIEWEPVAHIAIPYNGADHLIKIPDNLKILQIVEKIYGDKRRS